MPQQDPWEEAAKQYQVKTGTTASSKQQTQNPEGVSNPPNGGQVLNVNNPEPNDADWKVFQQTSQPDQERFSTSLVKSIPAAIPDLAMGALKSAEGRFYNLTPNWLMNLTGEHPSSDEMTKAYAPSNSLQSVGKAGEQAGEFLLPGLGEEAATTDLASAFPRLAPFARIGYNALASGAINKGQGGSFTTGALVGGLGSGLSEGMRAAAPTLAETALGVRGIDRLYGRTPGEAILNDTRGIKPGTIADSANETMSDLTPQLGSLASQAGQSGSRGSLTPARTVLSDLHNTHLTNRAVNSAAELRPLIDRLDTDPVTGLPLSAMQTPEGLLNMKRGINSDFIGNWRPEQPPGLTTAAKQTYRALNDEFHAAAPGTQELDSRISSLYPVAKRADAADLNAGILQRTFGRIARPTGALVGGLSGGMLGYEHGGLKGAIPGFIGGLVAPEVLSSPTTMMAGARAFNSPANAWIMRLLEGSALNLPKPDESQ